MHVLNNRREKFCETMMIVTSQNDMASVRSKFDTSAQNDV